MDIMPVAIIFHMLDKNFIYNNQLVRIVSHANKLTTSPKHTLFEG